MQTSRSTHATRLPATLAGAAALFLPAVVRTLPRAIGCRPAASSPSHF